MAGKPTVKKTLEGRSGYGGQKAERNDSADKQRIDGKRDTAYNGYMCFSIMQE